MIDPNNLLALPTCELVLTNIYGDARYRMDCSSFTELKNPYLLASRLQSLGVEYHNSYKMVGMIASGKIKEIRFGKGRKRFTLRRENLEN